LDFLSVIRYPMMTREHIPMLDTTSKSSEEIATTILHRGKLERRIF